MILNMVEDKYQNAVSLVRRTLPLESFHYFIVESSANKEVLFTAIRTCNVASRFNVWRMLLDVMSIDVDFATKVEQIQANRKRYFELKDEAMRVIHQAYPVRNPLLKLGPKQQDNETDATLREEIRKDVERTYQEIELFQDAAILRLLKIILFVWCKKNNDIGYQQGMNEVLASIVHVYFSQAVLAGETDKVNEALFNSYEQICSATYAEPDIYSVFDKIMTVQKEMYRTETDNKHINPNSKNGTPILLRICQIQDHRLRLLDQELFKILKLQEVKTKTFLLRWIRCMHTREFTLENSFYIWDCIFLEHHESSVKTQFQFIDAMCLAMFIYLRSLVLLRESPNQITQIYQKYPPIKKGQYLQKLLSLAWNIVDELKKNNLKEETNQKIKKNILVQKAALQEDLFKKQNPKKVQLKVQKKKQNKIQQTQMKQNTIKEREKTFTQSQLREIIALLKKSLSFNDNNESQAYTMNAINLLEEKLQ